MAGAYRERKVGTEIERRESGGSRREGREGRGERGEGRTENEGFRGLARPVGGGVGGRPGTWPVARKSVTVPSESFPRAGARAGREIPPCRRAGSARAALGPRGRI